MNVESDHPDYRDLAGYAVEELDQDKLPAVEEHLLICERCRQVVSESDVFASVLHGSQVSAVFTHEVGDHSVCLELRRLQDHKWSACWLGSTAPQSGVFETAAEAHAYLRELFEQQHPDHLCTEGCGSV